MEHIFPMTSSRMWAPGVKENQINALTSYADILLKKSKSVLCGLLRIYSIFIMNYQLTIFEEHVIGLRGVDLGSSKI